MSNSNSGATEATTLDGADTGVTDRRTALRRGAVATGAAAAAWAVPTISGIGITPANAAAACSPVKVQTAYNDQTGWPPAAPAISNFSFAVMSDNGGCSDPAAWTGTPGSSTQTVFAGTDWQTNVTINATGPVGNVDNPCGQTVAMVSTTSFTVNRTNITVLGTSCSLAPLGLTDSKTFNLTCNVSMDVQSCPPAGIANDNACGRAGAGGCSAALNGSASGTVTISCMAS